MNKEYKDKHGKTITIGDEIISDSKIRLKILDEVYDKEYAEDYVLFARQVEDPLAFSPLTADNLATQFTLVE